MNGFVQVTASYCKLLPIFILPLLPIAQFATRVKKLTHAISLQQRAHAYYAMRVSLELNMNESLIADCECLMDWDNVVIERNQRHVRVISEYEPMRHTMPNIANIEYNESIGTIESMYDCLA